MRSYFNGGGSTSSATPPPSMSGRARSGQILGARSSSASLPRSPESDLQAMMNVGGSSGSAQGSLGSHGSNQEVYVNIYQNTNHPSLFVSVPTNFNLRFQLTFGTKFVLIGSSFKMTRLLLAATSAHNQNCYLSANFNQYLSRNYICFDW